MIASSARSVLDDFGTRQIDVRRTDRLLRLSALTYREFGIISTGEPLFFAAIHIPTGAGLPFAFRDAESCAHFVVAVDRLRNEWMFASGPEFLRAGLAISQAAALHGGKPTRPGPHGGIVSDVPPTLNGYGAAQ